MIVFSLKPNFGNNVLSVLTKSSKSTVKSDAQDLHQSFRAQTAVLLPMCKPLSHLFHKQILSPIYLLYHLDNIGLSKITNIIG